MTSKIFNAFRTFAVMCVVAFVACLFVGKAEGLAATVSKIVVEGNLRIEDDTVESYLTIRPGKSYSSADVDDSIKALYATGLFRDVKISKKGNRLIVKVQENPVIRKVAFEGNSKFNDEQLSQMAQTKPTEMYSRTQVEADTLRLIEMYRRFGRYNVRVVPKVIKANSGRVDVVFEIDEGEKAKIESINFIGNKAFTDAELKDEISTTESGIFSFIKSSDVYDPDRLDADEEAIRRFYLSRGFADFRILSAVADFDREANAFYITFNVSEGKRYSFGDISVESAIPDIGESQLKSLFSIKKGEVYSLLAIEKTVEAITLNLAERGYVFSQVRPAGERNREAGTISVVIQIDEGPRVYVERINIKGNTSTLDYVIRREFDFSEGDAYNKALADRAVRRLNGLGYFKSVDIQREAGSAPDRIILNVVVVEQNTGKLNFGAGYSTKSGVTGKVSVTQDNFLGRGYRLKLAIDAGEDTKNYSFSFTDPRILDTRVSGTVSVFNTLTDSTTHKTTNKGGSIGISLPLAENLSGSVSYGVRKRSVTSESNNLSLAVQQSVDSGDMTIHDLKYALSYNTLDSLVNPKNGYVASFSQTFGNVGTESSYLKSTFRVVGYKELTEGVVLRLTGRGGHLTGISGGDGPSILDSFFFGKDLVRGFKYKGLGPRDLTAGASSEALGGTVFLGASAEVQMPVWGLPDDLGLKWAVFADAGTLYDPTDSAIAAVEGQVDGTVWNVKDIRSSVGIGILWRSPVGPLRFDYSKVLNSGEHDLTEEFSVGQSTGF